MDENAKAKYENALAQIRTAYEFKCGARLNAAFHLIETLANQKPTHGPIHERKTTNHMQTRPGKIETVLEMQNLDIHHIFIVFFITKNKHAQKSTKHISIDSSFNTHHISSIDFI